MVSKTRKGVSELEKFHEEERGYSKAEVHAFIESVIRETEGIIQRCKDQKEEIKKLTKKYLSTYTCQIEKDLAGKDRYAFLSE